MKTITKYVLHFCIILFLNSCTNSCTRLCDVNELDVKIKKCRANYQNYITFKDTYYGYYSITGFYLNSLDAQDSLIKYKIRSFFIDNNEDVFFCKRVGGNGNDSDCMKEPSDDFSNLSINSSLDYSQSYKISVNKNIIISNNNYTMQITGYYNNSYISFFDLLKLKEISTWRFVYINSNDISFENKDRSIILKLKKELL